MTETPTSGQKPSPVLCTTELRRNAHVLVLQEMRTRLTDAGSPSRTAALDAAISALSAHPSPGGQDAPRCDKHCQSGRADVCLASQRDGVICPEDSCDIDDGMRHNHLAARQPVGEHAEGDEFLAGVCVALQCVTAQDSGVLWAEIVRAVGVDDLLQYATFIEPEEWDLAGFSTYASTELNRRRPRSKAAKQATRPPPQAVDHQAALLAEERAHGNTIDQRDRCEEVADELAARIASITGVDIGEHSSANCPWQNAIEAAEEYKPAQAVDLADFKALYRAYVRLLESGRDRIRDLGGSCDPVDVMEANDVDLQAARRVLDSQAVGNG